MKARRYRKSQGRRRRSKVEEEEDDDDDDDENIDDISQKVIRSPASGSRDEESCEEDHDSHFDENVMYIEEVEVAYGGKSEVRKRSRCCSFLIWTHVALALILLSVALYYLWHKNNKTIEAFKSAVQNQDGKNGTEAPLCCEECLLESVVLFPNGTSNVGFLSKPPTEGFDGECGATKYGQTPGKWYKFQGTGNRIGANICWSIVDVQVTVFKGSCTEGLVCVDGSPVSCNNAMEFDSEQGVDYFLLAHAQWDENAVFEITLKQV